MGHELAAGSGYPVQAYGLFVALAHLVGIAGVLWRLRRRGLPWGPALDLILLVMVTGLVGARAGYLMEHPELATSGQAFRLERGGLSFFGGLALATPAFFLYLRWRRLPVRALADALCPVLPLSLAIVRLGCFAAGCCHGSPTSLPWGVASESTLLPPPLRGQPLHPSPLYEAAFLFALAAWLWWRSERGLGKPGRLAAFSLLAYGAYRLSFDFLRGDLTPLALGIAPSQWLAALLILLVVAFLAWPPKLATSSPRP